MQLLIAIDQAFNCLVYIHGDGFGYADETLSARSWRLSSQYEMARCARKLIDFIFFFDKDHCRTSYLSEIKRKHLPVEYRREIADT